jgi:hypothetical protein
LHFPSRSQVCQKPSCGRITLDFFCSCWSSLYFLFVSFSAISRYLVYYNTVEGLLFWRKLHCV